MDYNIPSHISPATIVMAARLARNAESIGFFAGNVYWDDASDDDTGDNVYFMFTNKHNELILVHCCPHAYFVEEMDEREDSIKFSMVTNIRRLLFKLRKNGWYDCEHLKKKENDE